MRKKLSLLLVALMAVVTGTWADNPKVTYALAEGATFTSGQSVDVKDGEKLVATITYGEEGDGYADFKAATKNSSVEGFTAFTEGNGVNGNKAGGTFYTIVPKFDGTIEVAVVLNKDKAFYIQKDGTALDGYNGMTVGEKYYGTYSFPVVAGSSYKVYCSGSKLGFYGFNFEYIGSWKDYTFTNFNFNAAEISGSNNKADVGDITDKTGDFVATDQETGIKLTVTKSAGDTPNRFWKTNSGIQLRVYGGTMTFEAAEGSKVKGIKFDNSKWNAENTADVGTLDAGKWTGEAQKVVITIKGNTQINNITVRGDAKVAYAVYADNILTFKYDKNMPVENAWEIGKNKNQNPGWRWYDIKAVAFDDSFAEARPDSCYYWFANGNIKEIIGWANFNTSEVKTMEGMFSGAYNLESINLSYFDTKNVENMANMFRNCYALKSLDLSKFNTEKVTNMNQMFCNMDAITSLDLSSFNTAKITNMSNLFYGCEKLESIKLGEKFTTGIVSNMSQMFADCKSLKALDLSGFDTRNVTQMEAMFRGCESLETLNVSSFNTVSLGWSSSRMFEGCAKLKTLDLSGFTGAGDMSHMFEGCAALESVNLSGITRNPSSLNSMFKDCAALTKLDLSSINTSEVQNFGHMFANCTKLAELNIDNFIIDYNYFSSYGESIYVVDEKDDDGNVTAWHYEYSIGLNYMFKNCAALTALNLMNMNTSNSSVLYDNMISMFEGCAKLATIDVTNQFVCYNNDNNMFKGCVALPDFNKGDNEGVIGGNGIEPYCNVYGVVANLWINAGKFITFYTDQAVKVKGETGKIYTITGITDTEVVVKELAVAAAKTPLLIENNSENDAEIILLKALKSEKATEVTKYPGFEGTLNGKEMPGSSDDLDYYILGNNNYFVKIAEGANGWINPNRCWLEIEKANVAAAPQLEIVEATAGFTGITTMKANGQKAEIYDLQGRKVGNAQKGMYIMNGKKVVIK
jgi:surface protein